MFRIAEQGGKRGAGIETRQTEPVNRAVEGDQRRGVGISNQAVIFEYRPESLVLETEFQTGHGLARIVDCMPSRRGRSGPRAHR
jgi:hypothetical protein